MLKRSILAENLRKSPYQANCLVAGVDEKGSSLYWLDYLGTLQKVTKGAVGYGSHFLYSIMDNYFNSNYSLEDGKNCIHACIKELKTRFIINLVNFKVLYITKDEVLDVSPEFNEKK